METAEAAAAQKFCEEWKTAFTGVLESLGAASVTTAWSVPLAPAPASNESVTAQLGAVVTNFTVRGAIQGAMVVMCQQTVAVQLAQLLQSEPPDPTAEFSELQRDAYAEFLRTVAGQVATGWKAETGNGVELILESAERPVAAVAQSTTLEIKSDKFAALSVQLLLDSALCSALAAPEKAATVVAAAGDDSREESDATTDTLAAHLSAGATPNLALLLDVELSATIRFGQRDMLLREVFGLMPGAVVELDQLVNEPADLLVAGRLIARGEVVVVDGNFGLRVTEVAAAAQRAALLEL